MPSPAGSPPRHLHPVVWEALCALAQRFAERGLHIFLFGSFAADTQFPGSDLDIGFESRPDSSPALIAELRRAVDDLPTVRRIDLVDFGTADSDFLRIARMHVRELA